MNNPKEKNDLSAKMLTLMTLGAVLAAAAHTNDEKAKENPLQDKSKADAACANNCKGNCDSCGKCGSKCNEEYISAAYEITKKHLREAVISFCILGEALGFEKAEE